MFGSYLGRAARSAPSAALPTRPTTGSSSLGAAATTTRPLTSTRSCGGQKHQRCHSSSKTSSCPPEGPKNSTSTDEARTTATTTTTTTARTASSSGSKKRLTRSTGDGEKRPGGRSGGRRKPRDAQQPVVIKRGRDADAFNLPIVPSTQHVEPTHISLSSFFSQHRPISLTSAIPDSSSEASFGAMFDPGSQRSRKQSDVIQTLSQTIDSFEEASEVKAEKDFRWNMLQNAPATSEESVTHLDGAPKQISLGQLITQFRPFNVPPAPIALRKRDGGSKRAQRQELERQGEEMLQQGLSNPKRRIWSTTLIVSESTFPDGTTSYAVATTPVSRMSEMRGKAKSPSAASSKSSSSAAAAVTATAKRGKRLSTHSAVKPSSRSRKIMEPPSDITSQPQRRIIRQPFLQRMLVKQWRWEQYWQERNGRKEKNNNNGNVDGDGGEVNRMLLISVKRQRRLKIKKHKFKKLMKRQRTLRRKLHKI